MNRVCYALTLLLIISSTPVFAGTTLDPLAEEATIVVAGTTVIYGGKISDQGAGRFLDAVSGKKVAELIIASSGGEVNAGMKMGEWVFDNHVDVVVERMCISSCANYIFTAGRRKTINANSIVAWHGSLLQPSGMSDEDVRTAVMESYRRLPESEQKKIDLQNMVIRTISQMREYRVSSTANQERFFRKIGVDEQICRIGNEKYGAKDAFLLSVEDMARFGVRDVVAPDEYEKIDLTPFRRNGKSIEFIKLK